MAAFAFPRALALLALTNSVARARIGSRSTLSEASTRANPETRALVARALRHTSVALSPSSSELRRWSTWDWRVIPPHFTPTGVPLTSSPATLMASSQTPWVRGQWSTTCSVLDCRYGTRLCRIAILEYHVGIQTIRGLMPGHQNGCAVSPLKPLWVSCLVYRAILGYLTIVSSRTI